MMDPPLQTGKNLPESSHAEDGLHTSLAATLNDSTSPSMAVRSRRAGNQHIQGPSSDDMLGQFSFAPATQTTVVTTTTTTTTSFPPLVIKAPHHLHELDSKLYPLASSPTPKSIKNFHFNVAGRPTFFSEAEDTLDSLQEVCLYNIGVIMVNC